MTVGSEPIRQGDRPGGRRFVPGGNIEIVANSIVMSGRRVSCPGSQDCGRIVATRVVPFADDCNNSQGAGLVSGCRTTGQGRFGAGSARSRHPNLMRLPLPSCAWRATMPAAPQ
jgi:hypothetical protein